MSTFVKYLYATAMVFSVVVFPPLSNGAAAGLIAAYSFDEGTGTRAGDSSTNLRPGTVTGATWTAGRFGNALRFDGADDWVTGGAPTAANVGTAVTIEAWVNPTALSGCRR